MNPDNKPLLIYDGDCTFCAYWIARWRHVTGDAVQYAPYQEVGDRYPEISTEKFQNAVQLIQPDGKVVEGAGAVFEALAYAPRRRWPLWLYRHLPGFAPVAEWFYSKVAVHRSKLHRLTRGLFGTEVQPPQFVLSRRVFLIFLALIYLAAFASLRVQMDGLLGSGGILPAAEFLEEVYASLGTEAYWRLPTLFWFNSSDILLDLVCVAGIALSFCLIAGLAPPLVLFLLWMCYLSLVNVGQIFTAFQWDTLLLETGFLAIFFAPFQWRPRLDREPQPSRFMLLLLRFLLFRLLFSSGLVKWLGRDPTWKSFTALYYHYETQPLPTWVGWYLHQLPGWFDEFSVLMVFFFLLVVPVFIFMPRRFQRMAWGFIVFFQVLIFLSGNYCFFNLLALCLSVLLLDDAFLKKILPFHPIPKGLSVARPLESWFKVSVIPIVGVLVMLMGLTNMSPFFIRAVDWPDPWVRIYQAVRPFRVVNSYGLFGSMTTVRREIVIEGSNDRETWRRYRFKWKPGDLRRVPGFVAPHQPRLDWQMWFAALGPHDRNPWYIRFVVRLLQGSGPVLGLLEHNPFPDAPPRYIRGVMYDYRFTNFEEREKDGTWWKREYLGLYSPVMQLPNSS